MKKYDYVTLGTNVVNLQTRLDGAGADGYHVVGVVPWYGNSLILMEREVELE